MVHHTPLLLVGTVISLGSVNPVLPAFALFVVLFLVFLGICVLPRYARIRARILDHGFSPGAHGSANGPVLSARCPASR